MKHIESMAGSCRFIVDLQARVGDEGLATGQIGDAGE